MTTHKANNMLTSSEPRLTYTTYYICHYCANFITTKKFDLVRHLTKQKKCCSYNDTFYEEALFKEAAKISENKKFYLNKDDVPNLTKEELQNYVNESIKEGIVMNKGEEGKIVVSPDLIKDSNYKVMKVNQNEFHLYFYDENIQRYKCYECSSEFNSQKLMESHILQKVKCEKVSKIHEAIVRAKLKEKYNNYEKIESIVRKCTSNNMDLDHLNFLVDQYISIILNKDKE